MKSRRVVLATSALALVFAGDALGCVRVDEPMSKRLDDSDAAVVGKVLSRRETVGTWESSIRLSTGGDGGAAVGSPIAVAA